MASPESKKMRTMTKTVTAMKPGYDNFQDMLPVDLDDNFKGTCRTVTTKMDSFYEKNKNLSAPSQ